MKILDLSLLLQEVPEEKYLYHVFYLFCIKNSSHYVGYFPL